MGKLIILDRDGVINEDSDSYVKSVDEWKPLPGSIEAITKLNKAGFIVAVATNQSGIARNYFSLATLREMHQKMQSLLSEQGGQVDSIKFCPHGPDDTCQCRKPLPGMIQEILQEQGINASDAWVVGDSLRDLQAGQAAGCQVALVKTGKGVRTLAKGDGSEAVPVFENLAEFCDFIIT